MGRRLLRMRATVAILTLHTAALSGQTPDGSRDRNYSGLMGGAALASVWVALGNGDPDRAPNDWRAMRAIITNSIERRTASAVPAAVKPGYALL